MADQGPEQLEQLEHLQLCIKNPGRHGDFMLRVPAGASVGQVMSLLQREYDGNPDPSNQTVRVVMLLFSCEHAGARWDEEEEEGCARACATCCVCAQGLRK
jgi:hypothetical protein